MPTTRYFSSKIDIACCFTTCLDAAFEILDTQGLTPIPLESSKTGTKLLSGFYPIHSCLGAKLEFCVALIALRVQTKLLARYPLPLLCFATCTSDCGRHFSRH